MLELRKKLANYQEIFYLLFLLPMTGMNSMGINSDDRIYLYVFALATVFLLLKMAVTDFTWREIVIMGVLTVLFGMNFLRNGEKTLILTVMAIFGAKNVNLDKVMKYALWEKAVLTVGTLSLAATGVIENKEVWLPKNGVWMTIYGYGYYHPNMAFANIFVILLLAVVVYQDKLKWYVYVIGTIILSMAYKVLICRTGMLVWGVLCIAIIGYAIANRLHKVNLYMNLYPVIPVLLSICTMVFPIIAKRNQIFSQWIDALLNGRVKYIGEVYDQIRYLIMGHIPQKAYDSMYFDMLYNYGWILFGIGLVAYVVGMWYCNRKGQYYITIALGIMAIYGFMELLSLSALWNLPLIYLSQILFQGNKVRNEQL